MFKIALKFLRRVRNRQISTEKRPESEIEMTTEKKEPYVPLLLPVADKPAANDALDRWNFVQSIYPWLLNNDDNGLVVGLEGEWGSGKSTLLRMALSKLVEREDVIVVNVNPWMISGSNALVEFILTQIAAAIGQKSPGKGWKEGIEVSKQLISYAAIFQNLKYLKLIPGAGWLGEIGKLIGETAEHVAKDGKEAAEAAEKLIPKLDLTARKKALEDAIKALGKFIVVALDDVDRLTEEEIKTTFQAIKAVADFPATTYLLAYDPNVVAKALHSTEVSGAAYLEKIVQITYQVPRFFGYRGLKFLDDNLRLAMKKAGIHLRPHDDQLFHHAVELASKLCKTPRHVVRLTNKFTISARTFAGELNLADVLLLETLSTVHPKVWRLLGVATVQLVGNDFSGSVESEWEETAENLKKGFDGKLTEFGLSEDEQRSIWNTLSFLFYRVEQLFGTTPIDRRRVADLRIDTPIRFRLYMTKELLETADSSLEVNRYFSDKRVLTKHLESLLHAEIPSFARRAHLYLTRDAGFNADESRVVLAHQTTKWDAERVLSFESYTALADLYVELIKLDEKRKSRRAELQLESEQLDKPEGSQQGAQSSFERNKPAVAMLDLRLQDEIISWPLSISQRVVFRLALFDGTEHISDPDGDSNLLSPEGQYSLRTRWAKVFSEKFETVSAQPGPLLKCMLLVWIRSGKLSKIREQTRNWCATASGMSAFISTFGEPDDDSLPLVGLIWDVSEFKNMFSAHGLESAGQEKFLKYLESKEVMEKMREYDELLELEDVIDRR
jgi:hypothetical protein